MNGLLTVEHADADADVLVVTNMWPHPDNLRYGVFVKRQVDSLIERGLRCDVLFIRGYRSPLAYPLAAGRLFLLGLRRKYALVHGHSGETALAVRFFVRAPVLVSYCGDDILGKPRADGSVPLAHRIRRWALRQHARLQTATITKSREMESALPPSVRAHNTVIPNGVDRGTFSPVDRGEARRRLGWGDEERVALFVADPRVERKRHWLAKAACELAGRELDDVRLEVAASSPPELVPTLMSAADCLLLTSIHEGSPNVVKEALACNLPVVATPAGDVRERLDAVEPSWVCEDRPEALASALVDCLREPRRSNGREASTGLGVGPIAEVVLDLYRRLRR